MFLCKHEYLLCTLPSPFPFHRVFCLSLKNNVSFDKILISIKLIPNIYSGTVHRWNIQVGEHSNASHLTAHAVLPFHSYQPYRFILAAALNTFAKSMSSMLVLPVCAVAADVPTSVDFRLDRNLETILLLRGSWMPGAQGVSAISIHIASLLFILYELEYWINTYLGCNHPQPA